jgi:hypothetical protein
MAQEIIRLHVAGSAVPHDQMWIEASDRLPDPGQLIVTYYQSHDTYWAGKYHRKIGMTRWLPLASASAKLTSAQCVVCGQAVEASMQSEHLLKKHAGPHKFRFDGKPFSSHKPSMTIAEIKEFVDCPRTYHVFQQDRQQDERLYYSDAQAVDLTRAPNLYADIPADGAFRT